LITYKGCNRNALIKPLAPPLQNLEIVSVLTAWASWLFAAKDGTPFDLGVVATSIFYINYYVFRTAQIID
jgi:hypothetical protein